MRNDLHGKINHNFRGRLDHLRALWHPRMGKVTTQSLLVSSFTFNEFSASIANVIALHLSPIAHVSKFIHVDLRRRRKVLLQFRHACICKLSPRS